MYPRNADAVARRKERQDREDNAPRLADEIPGLRELKLSVAFHRGEFSVQPGHVRMIIVERAPALFHVPCADRDCKNGGHDITAEVLTALRARKTVFGGASRCDGELGSAAARCSSELRYEAAATYE